LLLLLPHWQQRRLWFDEGGNGGSGIVSVAMIKHRFGVAAAAAAFVTAAAAAYRTMTIVVSNIGGLVFTPYRAVMRLRLLC